ncbi:28S rRNA (uridine-N(3))-methyltransferase-like [Convolutriloba macropyga]|uniref:28S rRNA (uridine-N(3))-methyltransferase-like n=1 Tax=Convolutriloba macropyga TaxID=536237 RepID=UPI003F5256BD
MKRKAIYENSDDDAIAEAIENAAEPVSLSKEDLVRAEFVTEPEANMHKKKLTPQKSVKLTKSVERTKKAKISVAIPGSILNNVSTLKLKTLLAGQIARFCAIFKVSEIIIFDDYDAGSGNVGATTESCKLMKKLLEFQIIPQYMRKFLFGQDEDLMFASLLHPLCTPHHMRYSDVSEYRDGITLPKRTDDGFSLANCGIEDEVILDRKLKPDICVTVKFTGKDYSCGQVVCRKEPFKKGIYWGYEVTIAESLTDLLQIETKDKYDLVIGTSDKGQSLQDVNICNKERVLVLVGGVQGLERALANDGERTKSISDCVDFYLNCCPGQGSRTIRTEEALPIIFSSLNEKLQYM